MRGTEHFAQVVPLEVSMGDLELKTPSISACAKAPHVSPTRTAPRRAHGPHRVPGSRRLAGAGSTRPAVVWRTRGASATLRARCQLAFFMQNSVGQIVSDLRLNRQCVTFALEGQAILRARTTAVVFCLIRVIFLKSQITTRYLSQGTPIQSQSI